ncbi:MAG: iron-sulfur cluster assembly scaffold protein [Chloroflexi bacterium]|nr:iron-sulfur cluster assembly scaffold protein [Chloroflexota bacterium]
MYNATVMEHFIKPRNVGEMTDPDGVGLVDNPQCGDVTRMFIKVREGRIAACTWQTKGCGAAIASSSAASEMAKGKTLEEAERLTRQEIAAALGGLPPGKVHCSVLAADALMAAIADYRRRTATAQPARS